MAPRRLLKAESRKIETRLLEFVRWFNENNVDLASPYIYPLFQVLLSLLSQIRAVSKDLKK